MEAIYTTVSLRNINNDISAANLVDLVYGMTNLQELYYNIDEPPNPFLAITDAHAKLTHFEVQVSSVLPWTDSDLQRISNLKSLFLVQGSAEAKETAPILSLKYLTALETIFVAT